VKLVVFDLDGTLTRKTARNLGLSSLGIASGARALVLRDNGASHVIEDYRDPDRCFQYLDEAQAP
jgi:phosphoglycolate phosphatase-like HAD superfamily hydrolase